MYREVHMLKQLEIYYDDLTVKKQQEYLDFAGAEIAEELNHEYIPIAIVEMDTEGV